MRSIAILLCAALFGLNAESALLHVHKDESNTHHHHGPATHQHKLAVHETPSRSALSEPDEDSTAIPVVLAKATTLRTHDVLAVATRVVAFHHSDSAFVPQPTLTPRAHGPPPASRRSPRAPPQYILL